MINFFFKLVCIFMLSACLCFSAQQYKPEIENYVKSLKNVGLSPVNYIFSLFEKYDIVVIGEHHHLEMTQWDFIYDIVKDERFLSLEANIFTEYCSSFQQPMLEEAMQKPNYEPELFRAILREFPIWPAGWNNNNIFEFLHKLYDLNKKNGGKIKLFFSDVPWKWQDLSKYEYDILWNTVLLSRDRLMADRISSKINELSKTAGKKVKSLVIMNTRHSYGAVKDKNGEWFNNTASFLSRNFPGRLANVMLHTNARNHLPDQPMEESLISDGKWDAAFQVNDEKPVGFNFKDTPFGQDSFDYHLPNYGHLRYQDVFTGMIYYLPLRNYFTSSNIEGFNSEKFKARVRKRCNLNGEDACKRFEILWKEYSSNPNFMIKRPVYNNEFLSSMNKWLIVP